MNYTRCPSQKKRYTVQIRDTETFVNIFIEFKTCLWDVFRCFKCLTNTNGHYEIIERNAST